MREKERIAQLEAENAALRKQVRQLQARLAELEGRLAKDSHNSSKPPSSDGLARRRYHQRPPSEKKSGGQPGHPGQTLKLVEEPDRMVKYRPQQCIQCHQSLEGVIGEVIERRQVSELPPLRLMVSEHQIEQVICPQWKPGELRQLSERSECSDSIWTGSTSAGSVFASVSVGTCRAHV